MRKAVDKDGFSAPISKGDFLMARPLKNPENPKGGIDNAPFRKQLWAFSPSHAKPE